MPLLRGRTGENLLEELIYQWNKYKNLKKKLLGHSTCHKMFYELVYGEIKDKVRDALIFEVRTLYIYI